MKLTYFIRPSALVHGRNLFQSLMMPQGLKQMQRFSHTASTSSTETVLKGGKEGTTALNLVRQIVDEHSANNRTFLLPWGDKQALEFILYPFNKLLEEGVHPEFLLDSCSQKDALFRKLTRNGHESYKLLQCFVDNFEMTFENAIRLLANWSNELMDEKTEDVERKLAVFLGRGVLSGTQIRKLVEKCPAILFAESAQKMDECWEQLGVFFSTASISKLMMDAPHICLLNPKELQDNYDYIYYHMGIEGMELVESKQWMNLELDQVMARHEFLSKTGKYFFPDPKKPQYKKENPTARKIFDTEDRVFATEVGQVTLDEWMVFQELWRHVKEMEDKERPYEIIKPSQRKAFQRQKKSREAEEGEILDNEFL